MQKILDYFNLRSNVSSHEVKQMGIKQTSHAAVIPQYLAVALGVTFEPYLQYYIANNSWSFSEVDFFGRALFGLIIAIVILPAVYKSSFDADKPILIQLVALFPMGLGWQSLFSAATKPVTDAVVSAVTGS